MGLLEEIKLLEDEIILHRRHLHAHPELSGCEHETLTYIRKQLALLDIPTTLIDKGGILAEIDSGVEGKTIMLRSDIDALPIGEIETAKNQSYCSREKGVMHACGHDAHTAMLLVAAKVLVNHKQSFKGRVLLCFEQGEEGFFNLRYILRHLEKNKVKIDSCFAMHVSPYIDNGKLMVNSGPIMAGLGKFDIEIQGQSGHGSRSDLAKNPIDCFADIMNGLQKARLNMIDPFEVFSMSVCEVHAGSSINIIPETLRFKGTYRYYNMDVALTYRQIIQEVCESAASLKQLEIIYHQLPHPSYPLINHPDAVQFFKEHLDELSGDIIESTPWMGSETYAYYLLKYPGMYLFLGTNNPDKGIHSDVHNAHFDVDESVLYKGVYAFVQYSIAFLNHEVSYPFVADTQSIEEIFALQGYEVND
ncbi:MAG: M20 family metallopeptidase [Erysipelotrichaceae bacterium]